MKISNLDASTLRLRTVLAYLYSVENLDCPDKIFAEYIRSACEQTQYALLRLSELYAKNLNSFVYEVEG